MPRVATVVRSVTHLISSSWARGMSITMTAPTAGRNTASVSAHSDQFHYDVSLR